MTEEEWLAGETLFQMPDALGDQSERKLRLAGCAVCRRLWHLLTQSASRQAVDVAERHADGAADAKQLTAARRGATSAANWSEENEGEAMYHGAMAVKYLLGPTTRSQDGPMDGLIWALDAAAHAIDIDLLGDQRDVGVILHCVFGNPFRPVTFLPEWRTSTVTALAQQMYDSRDFSAMPILADALADTACEDETILTHCRGPGPHCRGCHVIDALLRKS